MFQSQGTFSSAALSALATPDAPAVSLSLTGAHNPFQHTDNKPSITCLRVLWQSLLLQMHGTAHTCDVVYEANELVHPPFVILGPGAAIDDILQRHQQPVDIPLAPPELPVALLCQRDLWQAALQHPLGQPVNSTVATILTKVVILRRVIMVFHAWQAALPGHTDSHASFIKHWIIELAGDTRNATGLCLTGWL